MKTSRVRHTSSSSAPSAHPHVSYASHPHINDVNSSADAHFSTIDHSSARNVEAQKEVVYALQISLKEMAHSLQTSQREVTYAQKEIAHAQKEMTYAQKEIAHAQRETARAQKEIADTQNWVRFDISCILAVWACALVAVGHVFWH